MTTSQAPNCSTIDPTRKESVPSISFSCGFPAEQPQYVGFTVNIPRAESKFTFSVEKGDQSENNQQRNAKSEKAKTSGKGKQADTNDKPANVNTLPDVPDRAALAVAGGDNIERHVDDMILAVRFHLYRDKAPYVIGVPMAKLSIHRGVRVDGVHSAECQTKWPPDSVQYLRDHNFFHHLLRDVGYTFATLGRGPNLNRHFRERTDLTSRLSSMQRYSASTAITTRTWKDSSSLIACNSGTSLGLISRFHTVAALPESTCTSSSTKSG
ncbi:uncharacterized protein K444DRAFT_629587 [Hyaloscypha bicolor E]|uniref:Uncharacterized protein n=1 Tax=Hyaloscypha bicolor E TaxID=1095630 RepID=A0A2J6TAV4_9HELO|nr:uncharacterized protein K444DRAFT_629587 [Hyaloscypha bicolor E]PMD60170.1 hypothetical protein K444DRAFT_629587 [Hyaloscypha bicolor E]